VDTKPLVLGLVSFFILNANTATQERLAARIYQELLKHMYIFETELDVVAP
jgi:hypothetical protein